MAKHNREPAADSLAQHRAGGWGGARAGAGRPPLPPEQRQGVPHRSRDRLTAARPIRVTVRLSKGLRSLRSLRAHEVLLQCFAAAHKPGFRLVHYSIQTARLHLICEAKDRQAMSQGMQGLLIRVAKGLNRLWGRQGSMWAERYEEHVLATPREVRDGLCAVLNNHLRNGRQPREPLDPFASGVHFDGWRKPAAGMPAPATTIPGPDAAVRRPTTLLLRKGWRRCGLIGTAEPPP